MFVLLFSACVLQIISKLLKLRNKNSLELFFYTFTFKSDGILVISKALF